jgi:hypothetical protein
LDDIEVHAFTIFTKDIDSFYQFTFYAQLESFSKYLNDFKKMIGTLEFVSANETTKKQQPTFMSEVEETNNKTSKFIEKNKNSQDLLNIDNTQKQQ